MSLLKDTISSVSIATQADGTGTQSGTILDMAGFEGVLFTATFADVDDTAVLTLRAQQDTDSAGGTMATLTSSCTFTASATSADNKCLVLDVFRPAERYVRPQVVIATANAITASVIAIQYGAHKAPTTQGSTVLDNDLVVSPAEV